MKKVSKEEYYEFNGDARNIISINMSRQSDQTLLYTLIGKSSNLPCNSEKEKPNFRSPWLALLKQLPWYRNPADVLNLFFTANIIISTLLLISESIVKSAAILCVNPFHWIYDKMNKSSTPAWQSLLLVLPMLVFALPLKIVSFPIFMVGNLISYTRQFADGFADFTSSIVQGIGILFRGKKGWGAFENLNFKRSLEMMGMSLLSFIGIGTPLSYGLRYMVKQGIDPEIQPIKRPITEYDPTRKKTRMTPKSNANGLTNNDLMTAELGASHNGGEVEMVTLEPKFVPNASAHPEVAHHSVETHPVEESESKAKLGIVSERIAFYEGLSKHSQSVETPPLEASKTVQKGFVEKRIEFYEGLIEHSKVELAKMTGKPKIKPKDDKSGDSSGESSEDSSGNTTGNGHHP